jgi:type I restriction enzyme, S subunit
VTFPSVPLSEIAKPVMRNVAVTPGVLYRTIGVKWWGEGAYERQTIDGTQTAAKALSVVRTGDLIINKIWVRHGSVAIASSTVEGCAASGEFPTFELNRDLVFPGWIHWQTRTRDFWSKCDSLSRGTSGKNRIKPELFLTIEVPLPSLQDQRRIVARIESLSARIEEARGLRQQTNEETGVLATRACSQILDNPRWEFKRLESVLAETPRNGLSPQRETQTNGRPMLRINAVSSTPSRFVDLSVYKNVEVSEGVASPFVLQHDDVFIVRYNGDINRVAKAAIFKGEKGTKVVYPDKLMRLRTDLKKMLPDFLVFALGSRTVREQIEELGKTTAGQIGISGADAKSFVVPVPPVEELPRWLASQGGRAEEIAGRDRR